MRFIQIAAMVVWAIGLGSLVRAAEEGSVVRIIQTDQGYRLQRDGKDYFIKGAVGAYHPELLVASGGNSIRAGVQSLDRAKELGLTCLVGLPLGNPRHGFDYADQQRVEAQFSRIKGIVEKYKDHPAVLMWAIGNEPEISTTPEQRVAVWREVNRIATMIKQVDGQHPVITVVGDAYKRMLSELDTHCPALDAVGLNSYVDMLTLPEDLKRQGWKRPYVVSEFGPRGHWQVPKTPWKMPIEDTSTEKAEFYLKAYRHSVENQRQCLGAYVFYWSHKQEKTHTWYGLFLPDGSRTGAIDTMVYAWTGQWPKNRCPRVTPIKVALAEGSAGQEKAKAVFAAGAQLRCEVEADDPDGDAITIKWDLRKDVANNPNVGGDYEPPTAPIEGTVISKENEGRRVVVKLPTASGAYRLFVYVYDGQGNAATANVPVLAEAEE